MLHLFSDLAHPIHCDPVSLVDDKRMISGFQFEVRPHVGSHMSPHFQQERVRINLDPRTQPPNVRAKRRIASGYGVRFTLKILFAEGNPGTPDEWFVVVQNRDLDAATYEEIFAEKNAAVAVQMAGALPFRFRRDVPRPRCLKTVASAETGVRLSARGANPRLETSVGGRVKSPE